MAEAFGKDWIGEVDKKYYVWSQENGTPMQVCITMTIPKNPLETEDVTPSIGGSGALNFEDMPVGVPAAKPVEVSQEEIKLAEDLLARLGL